MYKCVLLLGLIGNVFSHDDYYHYGEKLSKQDCKSADWFEENEKTETVNEMYSSFNLYLCRYEAQSIEDCRYIEPVLSK